MNLDLRNFYKTLNIGDCSVRYFDKEAYRKAVEETKPKRIPKGKKLMLDPFVGYVLIDK